MTAPSTRQVVAELTRNTAAPILPAIGGMTVSPLFGALIAGAVCHSFKHRRQHAAEDVGEGRGGAAHIGGNAA